MGVRREPGANPQGKSPERWRRSWGTGERQEANRGAGLPAPPLPQEAGRGQGAAPALAQGFPLVLCHSPCTEAHTHTRSNCSTLDLNSGSNPRAQARPHCACQPGDGGRAAVWGTAFSDTLLAFIGTQGGLGGASEDAVGVDTCVVA